MGGRLVTRWMRGPEIESARDRDLFDPIVEGARYRLSRELSLAIWERTCAAATDEVGRCDLVAAQRQFHAIAARIAVRGGRRHPDVGRLTRVVGDDDVAHPAAPDELAIRVPGRETLIAVEARRRAMIDDEPVAAGVVPRAPADAIASPEPRMAVPGPSQPPGTVLDRMLRPGVERIDRIAISQLFARAPANRTSSPSGPAPGLAEDPRTWTPPSRRDARPADRFTDILVLGLQQFLRTAMERGGVPLVEATLDAADPDVARRAWWSAGARRNRGEPRGKAMWRAAERHAATLYRRAVDSGEIEHDGPAVEAALQRCGAGQPLPDAVRRTMEARLGVPLERVRIHSDDVAAEAAQAVNAEAFTVGEDIFFARGAYAPASSEGQRLLAHELTHVVQAWQGRTASTGRVSTPDDALEREAETVAAQVSTGGRVERAQHAGSEASANATSRGGGAIADPTSGAAARVDEAGLGADRERVVPRPAPLQEPAAQPLLRRAAQGTGQPRASKPAIRGGAGRVKPGATRREMTGTTTDFAHRASQATTQATRKLQRGLAAAKNDPPGKRAHDHATRDRRKGQADEHDARTAEQRAHDKANARAAHTPEAPEVHAEKRDAVDTRSPIQFKPIADWSKYMPAPLPDQDERERKRIEALVRKKIEGERSAARQGLETLRAAHQEQARDVRAMQPRLQAQIAAAQQKALATVAAAESSQCAAVQRQVASVQGQVRGAAGAAKAQVTSAHAAAVAKINAAHDAADEKLTKQKTKALADADTAESLALLALTFAFLGLKGRFTTLGQHKAGDAITVGDEEAAGMAGRWDGDKLEAAQKAAHDTADGFATSMPEQAVAKFGEIEAKRPEAEVGLRAYATTARDAINKGYDAAKASIDAARQSSIQSCNAAKDAATSQIDQACASTVASLAAHGASQVAAIRKQGQGARTGIIAAAAASRAGVAQSCERAASGVERGIVGLIRGARQIEAPDPEEAQQQVRQGAQDLQRGAAGAAKGLSQTATGASQSLADQASGAAEGMASVASAAASTATQMGAGARQQMTGIASGTSQSLGQLATAHKTTTDATVTAADEGFAAQVKALGDNYKTAADTRKTEFDNNYDQCKAGLDAAVPDRGGGGGGVGSGKKEEGGESKGGESKGEVASIQEAAQKAADAVKPWWQKALAVVVSVVVAIAVVIVVTALVATTGPLGVILVGAAAGALSTVAGTMASNLVLGNNVFDGITWQSVLIGAAGGAIGAGLTQGLSAGAKALAGSARFGSTAVGRGATAVTTAMKDGAKTLGQQALKTGVETATDVVSEQAANLIVSGKLDLSVENLVMSLATNAATGHHKFEGFQNAVQNKIPAPFHLKVPKLGIEIGRAPATGGPAHGGGEPPAAPTSTPHADGHAPPGPSANRPPPGGGHQAPGGGGAHNAPPSSGDGSHAPASAGGDRTPPARPAGDGKPSADPDGPRPGNEPPAKPGHDDPGGTRRDPPGADDGGRPRSDGDASRPPRDPADTPGGDASRPPRDPADTPGGDAGKPPRDADGPPRGDGDAPQPRDDADGPPRGDGDPARPRGSDDPHSSGDPTRPPPAGNDPAGRPHGHDDAPHAGDGKPPHPKAAGDAGDPHHGDGDGHAAAPRADAPGAHPADDGSPADAAAVAHDAEMSDLGYPAGTRAKRDEVAAKLESGTPLKKDVVRDTEANQRGIDELQRSDSDPKRTDAQKAEDRRDLAAQVREHPEPPGNLPRDIRDARAQNAPEGGSGGGRGPGGPGGPGGKDPGGPRTGDPDDAGPVSPDDFPSPHLPIRTNDPAQHAKFGEFAKRYPEIVNKEIANLKQRLDDATTPEQRAQAFEDMYRNMAEWRARVAQDMGGDPAKFRQPIADNDPNYDPFGDMPGLREGAAFDPATGRYSDGPDTPASRTRRDIGDQIARRFDGADGDVIQNQIKLPDGETVNGNLLHRGDSAQSIYDRKRPGGEVQGDGTGKPYGYDPDSPKLFSETADPANQQKLHDAGVKLLADIAGRGPLTDPAARRQAQRDFADAAYMLFNGPLLNRGSDSTLRAFLTAAYTHTFGNVPRLPHDIDVQAYARTQADFIDWLTGHPGLSTGKPGGPSPTQGPDGGPSTPTTGDATHGDATHGDDLPKGQVAGGRYGKTDEDMELWSDPDPTPEAKQLQDEARAAHPNDPEAQLDYIWKNQTRLRQPLLARRDADIPQVADALQQFGIAHATPETVGKIFDYLFNSAGLGFHYPNYQAWMRLATGRATVADARFFVHESTEIGLMEQAGVDFMGNGLTPGSPEHTAWYENTFQPAYMAAHRQALRAEYNFLADQLTTATGGALRLTPEELAAIDPASDEGRTYMQTGDGTDLSAHPSYAAWQQRANEVVTVPPATAARLGLQSTEIKLADLVSLIRRSPIAPRTEP